MNPYRLIPVWYYTGTIKLPDGDWKWSPLVRWPVGPRLFGASAALADKKPPLPPLAFSQTYDTILSVGRTQRCSSLWSPLGALSTCFCPLPLTVIIGSSPTPPFKK